MIVLNDSDTNMSGIAIGVTIGVLLFAVSAAFAIWLFVMHKRGTLNTKKAQLIHKLHIVKSKLIRFQISIKSLCRTSLSKVKIYKRKAATDIES